MSTLRTWIYHLFAWTLVFAATSTYAGGTYVTYLHPDTQGSPAVATDEQGNVVWTEAYDPWGARQIKNSTSASTARGSRAWYTGKEEEASLGLYYYGARWYSPDIGQFHSTDPASVSLSNPRSFNRYAYANNNPIRFIDPDGKWSTDAHNYFIDQAFPHLSKETRGYIKEGSRAADAWYNQVSGDHIHSMWPEGGSAESMAQLRSDYIRERMTEFSDDINKANVAAAAGETNLAKHYEAEAWREYGKAQHPIMDSTSPVHNQQWNLKDYKKHGNFDNSQEDMRTAPAYRDITVNKMQNMQEFLKNDK